MKQYEIKISNISAIKWERLPRAEIDSYVWGGADAAHKACGQVAYAATGDSSEGLYIHLCCEEKDPVSVTTEHNGPVWEDSCLEFFFTMSGSDGKKNGYVNIECNSNGVTLIAYGKDRHERTFIVDMDIEPFPVKLVKSEDRWELFEFVPLSSLKKIFGITKVDESTVMWGNFYRCDENGGAPFGSWAPVNTPQPDFHCPQCFGRLLLVN